MGPGRLWRCAPQGSAFEVLRHLARAGEPQGLHDHVRFAGVPGVAQAEGLG